MHHDILNILRTWTKRYHEGNQILKYEARGWRHDAASTWDIFVQAHNKGIVLMDVLPATSQKGGVTVEGRLANFFSQALYELQEKHAEDGQPSYQLFRCRMGECPVFESGNWIHDAMYRAPRSCFERCVRESLVPEFRRIIARRLGL
jgi:hypothetical protein